MKTYLLKLAMTSAGFLLISIVLCHSVAAQTVISFDSSPDNTMVFKIRQHKLDQKPHRYVFIFDSAKITYEIDLSGEVELYTFDLSSGTSNKKAYLEQDRGVPAAAEPEFVFDPAMIREKADEEPFKVEAWMLTPEKWID